KPVYGHSVELEFDCIVVMGYRDFAGDDNCPASNGVVCLIKDEVEYASAQGRTGLVRSGLETMNVAPGQPEHVTFYEEGEQLMNSELKIVDAYFSKASGFGGFAIHNYSMAYLSGTEGWPYFAPTSAPVSIGGRVVTSSGHGISGARLTLTVSGEARH